MSALSRRHGIGLIVLSVLLLVVRVVGLSQYPQVHPDEGFWACGARNYVLYGNPLLDGRLHPFLTPGTFAVLSGYFSLIPPDLFTARLFSVIAGLSSCVMLGLLIRREVPALTLLGVLLFGLTSMSVLIQRQILLEAHLTFWLILSAYFWLSDQRGRSLLAGIAFGMALLVKSNCIYLLPAFFLSVPLCDQRPRWRSLGSFVLACLILAGGVYGTLWWLWPNSLHDAFTYELSGKRLGDARVLFQIGRFGIHPARAISTLRDLLVAEPLLWWSALISAGWLATAPATATRADRFFAAWLAGGLLFLFGQIYTEYRYFTTLVPALVFLTVRLTQRIQETKSNLRQLLLVGAVICFCLIHLGRISLGITRKANANYWEVIAWMKSNVEPKQHVLAAPIFNLSLPQKGYDFFRMIVPYHGPHRPLEQVVTDHDITYLIVDTEWREYLTPEQEHFFARHCKKRTRIGDVTIYEVNLVAVSYQR